MSKLKLEVGDIVAETYRGYYSHKRYHGKDSLELHLFGIPLGLQIKRPKRPRWLWRPRVGEVVEVQGRWWMQDGCDVKVRWRNGDPDDWRLADTKHLRVVRRKS